MFTLLLQPFHDLDGAVGGDTFLVAGDQKGDAAAVVGMLGDEALAGGDHGGEAAFHVRGAAAVENAVLDHRLEGGVLPLLRGAGGYHVGVAGKAQYGPLLAAHRPEVVHILEAQALDPKADGLQAPDHQVLAAGVFRRDRLAADQIQRQVDSVRGMGHNKRVRGQKGGV